MKIDARFSLRRRRLFTFHCGDACLLLLPAALACVNLPNPAVVS